MNNREINEPHRPLSPAGRRIVEAAEELFYNRGITAVGVDLVAEHSGVSKRTLYNQFGSKEHLVAAYLGGRDERWRTLVETAVVTCDDPVEAVTAPFVALEEWSKTNTRGCAFINALAELPDPAHPARQVATNQKLWLLNLFENLATTAGATAPSELAIQLLLLHEGVLAIQPLRQETLRISTELALDLTRASIADKPITAQPREAGDETTKLRRYALLDTVQDTNPQASARNRFGDSR